jgi:dTDP-4-dehydrorhamnose 3,5-epimerase-like enzyme
MCSHARYNNGEVSWRLMSFTAISEDTGELGVLEYGKELDFLIKRVFYIRSVKENAIRGLHSHKDLKQIMVCLNGEFTIELDNGHDRFSKRMTPNNHCLYIDGKVWREMKDFTIDAVVMVLCDREYRYDEIVRSRDSFLKYLDAVNNEL